VSREIQARITADTTRFEAELVKAQQIARDWPPSPRWLRIQTEFERTLDRINKILERRA
jgi:hypothetical protein